MANKFLRDIRDEVVARGVTKSVYDPKTEKTVQVKMTKEEVENVLRMAFDVMGDILANGDKLYVIGFMNFEPKDYKPKKSKHPQTGEPMMIPGYRAVLAKPSEPLKEKLASGYERSQKK